MSSSNRNDGMLDRREVAAALLRDPSDLLVVTGLGAATYDVGVLGDREQNFYLWGAMGGTAMIGLGLALAQPTRRVLVITGDGEMLMGMGSLASIAAARAPNLAIAVLDNARFGETGSQHSHTGLTTDLESVAAGCGWTATTTARDMAAVEALRPRLRAEPLFAVIRISAEEKPRFIPPRDGAYVTERFRRALGIVEN
ncbi:MAG TPA: thiamine pyrophosphate-dependent enzyme [Acetobacteraceae bacterium]|jgi:thiamine pyrophosphate-dependent acetolactate synthase large subunit-like protein|nr:thiamine pyrophosphate-dependent enzyme [Acetobacteraceae bacterium]